MITEHDQMSANEVLMKESHGLVNSIKLTLEGAPALLTGLESSGEEPDWLPSLEVRIVLLKVSANPLLGCVTGESKFVVGIGVSQG